jgi:hypothetical protein
VAQWSYGTSCWPVLREWDDYEDSKGRLLVTFNNYLVEPGVILYDFLDKEQDEDVIKQIRNLTLYGTATAVSIIGLDLLFEYWEVKAATAMARSLATMAAEVDQARMESQPSVATARIIMCIGETVALAASFAVGFFGFGSGS